MSERHPHTARAPPPRDREAGEAAAAADETSEARARRPKEIGGPSGPEPTRYGDWERRGRCSDF